MNVLQKKMPNGLVTEEKLHSDHPSERGVCTIVSSGNIGSGSGNNGFGGGGGGGSFGGGPSSGESLMSSLSSGSLHSPHVTMSGPVTDL